MTHVLPKLPYSPEALEPFISKKTIEYHYGKHHMTYVKKLNELTPGSPFENSSLEDIIMKADGGIFNNGAQVWNHTFYWESFSPNGGGEPEGKLMNAIEDAFGSFEKFRESFSNAAATLFGSGWTWLVKNKDDKLEILQTGNADNPMRQGFTPLLTCDVWEHAYYLDYQNRRPEYVNAFWKIIDWKKVDERM
ncbi:MAG: superoxide dismutase [Bacteroidia bacterium]|nr:MAG: superoxide dismutase [Bacteroidia bacterium]